MSLVDTRKRLMDSYAKLGAHKAELNVAKGDVVKRAKAQRDSIAPMHDTVAEYVGQGQGGGVLGHRQLKTLQVERQRLDHCIHCHGEGDK